MVLDAWTGLVGDAAGLVGRLPGRAGPSLDRSLRGTGRALEGLLALGRNLTNTEPLSIEGAIGPHRRWTHSSSSLDDVRVVRRAFGGTINDVVLTRWRAATAPCC